MLRPCFASRPALAPNDYPADTAQIELSRGARVVAQSRETGLRRAPP